MLAGLVFLAGRDLIGASGAISAALVVLMATLAAKIYIWNYTDPTMA